MKLKSNNLNQKSLGDPAIVRELCQSLKQMRLNKNMSQSQLAEISGLDRTTISRMESGRAATLLTFVQVLRALNKLELLNTFKEVSEISPLQILKIQEKQRQKASPKKDSTQNKEKSQW